MPTLPSTAQAPGKGGSVAPAEGVPAPKAAPGRLPRIAVLGLRGVPASWGGVERQCEELYTRLATAGFPVTIYCRSSYVPQGTTSYKGIRLIRLPAVAGKHMEAFLHTFLACLHLLFTRCDIVHLYSQGPALFAPLLRLLKPGCRIFFTCGGLDWQRKKWSPMASGIIRCGEWCSARFTDVRVMVSETLCRHYRKHHGVGSLYIPNGVTLPTATPLGRMTDLGIAAREYALFVGRLVPEKRIQDLIAAVALGNRGLKLVIAGGTAGCEEYVSRLHAAAAGDTGIIFAGYRFGEELAALFSNALVYVTASELEGLPLSLLEGMAYSLPCVASDIPPHREVLGETGTYFPVGDVDRLCERLDAVKATEREALAASGAACRKRAASQFSWDTAADQLARAYIEACF